MTWVGTRHDAARLLIALAAATGLAIWFGDRVGVEGDDLAIIEGATHFDLKPRDALYRFAWQPVSYFLAHGLTQMGLAPLSLTYLPNILGGAGLVLLAETLRLILRTPDRTWMAYALVLAVPELWITILYFNTTALGLAFFCASLFLLCLEARDVRAWTWNLAAAAVLYALACGFRLDFAAASLILLLIVYCRAPSRAWLSVSVFFLVAAASGLTILTSLGVGPSDLLHIVRDFETHPWQAWQSVVVFALAILPLILMSPFLLGEIIRRPWPRQPILFWPALALCALPMLYPLISLYSAKYLIPAFCVGLVGLAFLLRELPARSAATAQSSRSGFAKATVWGIGIILLASYALGLQVHKRRVVGVSWTASLFGTYDGGRPYGGYLAFLGLVRDPEQRGPYLVMNRRLADWFMRSPGDAVAIVYDGSDRSGITMLVDDWSWGWPALYLYSHGWVLDAYTFRRHIAMHAPDGRKAEIIAQSNNAPAPAAHRCFIEIGPVSTSDEDTDRYLKLVSQAACRP
jgi:hypothetical protein